MIAGICLMLAAFGGLATSTAISNLNQSAVSVTTLARNLAIPWGVAFLPDGGALVTERLSRRILKVGPEQKANGDLATTVVATITEAYADNERGLLGIAASPDFAQDNTVYIHYTSHTDNRIARLKLGERPKPIVTGIPVAGLRDGGRLAFGPDGYLYATTGDASRGADAQDLKSLGGKILRMTTDGKPAPGNPFPNSLVWSYGHRNPEGLAWDGAGRMYGAEIGESVWDELNVIERGGNYGWPKVEGIAGDPRYIDPIVVWHPEVGVSADVEIMGDVAVVTCLRGQRLYLVKLDDTRAGNVANSPAKGGDKATPNMRWRPAAGVAGKPEEALVGKYGRLRSAVTAPDGSIWLTTSNKDGRNPNPTAIDDDRILQLTL
jgi:glucose/arabinose dehydrogenase